MKSERLWFSKGVCVEQANERCFPLRGGSLVTDSVEEGDLQDTLASKAGHTS